VKATQSRKLSNLDPALLAGNFLVNYVADQNCADADEYCDALLHSLHVKLDAIAPLRTLKGRRPAVGHFALSTEACQAKKDRRYLERRLAHGGTNRDRGAYRSACRHATRLIKKSLTISMTNQLDAASGNLRQLWGAENDLLHPASPPVVHPAGWATNVSDYFISKVSTIKD